MKLPAIAVVLLISAAAFSQPVSTHYLPKEYYQRQNLPERPGYIPVYIKHDDEPLIKWDGGSTNGRTSEQIDVKEALSVNQGEQEAENKSTATPEKAQAEQKSKTKKVTENSSQKRKDSKE